MPVLNTHIETHHSSQDLYNLVSDIERYPDFIRWITAMRVSNTKTEGYVTSQLGEMVVGFKGFSERFSTLVTADPLAKTVSAKLVRGPFRRLHNTWTITGQSGQPSRVKFFLDYEFSNPVLAMLARSNTEKAVDRIMHSFVTEANRRYGPAPVQS